VGECQYPKGLTDKRESVDSPETKVAICSVNKYNRSRMKRLLQIEGLRQSHKPQLRGDPAHGLRFELTTSGSVQTSGQALSTITDFSDRTEAIKSFANRKLCAQWRCPTAALTWPICSALPLFGIRKSISLHSIQSCRILPNGR
jgi:hypothetical protein